jgi:hypothetical protein
MERHSFENEIYASLIGECEAMEAKKAYKGNGHHLAQRLTKVVADALQGQGASANKVEVLNLGYWHEALDRTNSIQTMADELLVKHPVFTNIPELKKELDECMRKFGDMYQSIGQLMPD